jgi:hypothetical protein
MLPGRCTNEMYCTLGASGRLIQVPEGAPFVCPLCGKVLASPALRPRDRLRAATLFSIGVGVAVFAAFFGGMLVGVSFFPQAKPDVELVAATRLKVPPPEKRFIHLAFLAPVQWAPKPAGHGCPARPRPGPDAIHCPNPGRGPMSVSRQHG